MVDFNVAFSSFFNQIDVQIKENGYASFKDKTEEWTDSGKNRKALFSRMYYILKGEAYIIVNGEKILMTPGNLYFLPLGLDYTYGFDSYVEKLYFHINVSVPRLTHVYDLFCDCEEVVILQKDNIDEMLKLYKSDDLINFLKLKAVLYSDVIKILDKMNITRTIVKSYSDICFKALQYIKDNLSANLKIKDIASNLYISESKLNKLFALETGTQIGKYIDDMLFFEIEKMVLYSKHTDEEISQNFEFSDIVYFRRFFKKRTGYTPKQYRISNRINSKTEII